MSLFSSSWSEQDDYSECECDLKTECMSTRHQLRPSSTVHIQSGFITSLEEIRLVELTTSHQLLENLLKSYYVPLEIWYIRTTIDKVYSLFGLRSRQLTACTRLITYQIQTPHSFLRPQRPPTTFFMY